MCGRYVLKANLPEIARMLGIEPGGGAALAPRYNIAPTQAVPACRADAGGERRLVDLRWGLVPRWAKDAKVAYRMINARAETVAEKPAFRDAFRRRRCLLPADGYYEWKRAGTRKQPYYLSRRDGSPFCFAGLWERWQRGDAEPIESCAIITTAADGLAADIHDRMPVILDEGDFARWLDPALDDTAALAPLLAPRAPDGMTYVPVSTLVNNPRVDEPRCITPLADAV
ncbi:MAG: SOS response-associated peptidase [Kiloniellales bacterium]|nr:SOS response-associated peptidase [Kiloniellales bacterium]